METEGKGAQYVPVWLELDELEEIVAMLNARFRTDAERSRVEYVIQDAIEWAEGR